MFSNNQGDYNLEKVITKDDNDSSLAVSCVQDNETGDIILKMVNYSDIDKQMNVNLSKFGRIDNEWNLNKYK